MSALVVRWKRSYQYAIVIVLLAAFPEIMFAQVDMEQPFKISPATKECYPCLTGDFWRQEKKSVVRIVTFREGETIMCTGSLVNNTAQDSKPYVLTANHCLSNQDDVDNAIFTFNYDDVNCDGVKPSQGTSMVGGKLRASSYANDFALVELDHHVPLAFHPFFAGWDITGKEKKRLSCIHHPQAGVKRISVENDFIETSNYTVEGMAPRAANAFWKVRHWDIGFTERGSSGAPLFDSHHHIIGTLSGGKATCEAPDDDYFQKLSAGWTASILSHQQLRYWLDPLSTGITVMDGFDPVEGMEVMDDTITNIGSDDATRTLLYANDEGYVGGCNKNHVTSFAEEFYSRDSAMLTRIHLYLGAVETDAAGGVIVSVNAADNDVPGWVLAEMYVPYSQLHFFSNYLEFYPGVKVKGKFFVVCSPDCSETNQFAIDQADWRASKRNTAWLRRDSDWIPMTQLSADGLGSSFYIEAILTTFPQPGSADDDLPVLNLYPNPTMSILICSMQADRMENYQVTVCNSNGQAQNVEVNSYASDFLINVACLDPGVYFLKVSCQGSVYYRKFLKM